MNKRKTFSRVFYEKLLISVPLILIIILSTIFVLKQYSKSIVAEAANLAPKHYIDKMLDAQKARTFEENYNFIKFRTNLTFETIVSRYPGIKAYIYITDPDGNVVMDSSPAWGYLSSVRDENMDLIDRYVYICDYESLCRFEKVKDAIDDYNNAYSSTLMEVLLPVKKSYPQIEILEGYVDPETAKLYPTTVAVSYETINTWMGMYEDPEYPGDNWETISIQPDYSVIEGMLPYRFDLETNEAFIDGEKLTGLHILLGRNLSLEDYRAYSRRPLSYHVSSEDYYTDASGREYVIVTKICDNFLETYLSFIIVLSILYILIDVIVCLLLAKESYNKLKIFYQNEDYRKALMNSMAHDLKTPLTVMSGYAENLKENVQTEKREHYADSILENTAYMNGIITDVLELSKVEDNKSKENFEKFDFCDIAKETVNRYAAALEEKNISTDVTGSFTRKANKAGMERVMDNIIGNAVKYTNNGGSIKIYAKDKPFSRHELIIENSPIAPLTVKPEKLWEPFVKGDESRSENNGTGLGLSIVRNILLSYGFKSKIKVKGNSFNIIIK